MIERYPKAKKETLRPPVQSSIKAFEDDQMHDKITKSCWRSKRILFLRYFQLLGHHFKSNKDTIYNQFILKKTVKNIPA